LIDQLRWCSGPSELVCGLSAMRAWLRKEVEARTSLFEMHCYDRYFLSASWSLLLGRRRPYL
jgi:hypothetical protein